MKNRIYAKQDEIKSTNLIKKQTIEKNRTKNKEYAEQFVKTVSDYNITTFCIIMKRRDHPKYCVTLQCGVK